MWKVIPNYPNYQVSNTGEVKSLNYNHTKEEKILSQGKVTRGYLSVVLVNDYGKKMFLVHRLVAELFLNNPNNYNSVNHKNEDKTNNSVDNLEWCDNRYNINYGTANARRSETLSRIKCKRVNQINADGKVLDTFNSVLEAKSITGISHIGDCCNGNRTTAGGYKWSWNEQES